MEIRTPITVPSTAPVRPANLTVFAVGALLDALVQERLPNQRYLLQLAPNGPSLTASSSAELAPGQPLKLEVVKTGPTPELRIVPRETTSSPETVIHQTLRVLLPRQLGLDQLAAALLAVDGQKLPAPARGLLSDLLARLPDPAGLIQPGAMQHAVRESGVFFEARILDALIHGADFPIHDLKGKLLRLLEALQAPRGPGSPEQVDIGLAREFFSTDSESLAHRLEGALARVALDQLASLPRPDGSQVWRMEIPFGGESGAARLLIASEERKREGKGGKEGERHWTVTLELEPPGLGRLFARVLWNGVRIDAYLWSDRPETLARVRENTEILRARMEQAGLEVGHLAALERAPTSERAEPNQTPLLDLRA